MFFWRDIAGPVVNFPDVPKKTPSTGLDLMAGLRLRAVRQALEVRQETMAKELGIGRTTLANWEGGMLPDVRVMMRLFVNHGISIEWIYAGLLRNVPYEMAQRLKIHAAELGAAVGSPGGLLIEGHLIESPIETPVARRKRGDTLHLRALEKPLMPRVGGGKDTV
jgi:DNA-binding XRE family transcriptional regulator